MQTINGILILLGLLLFMVGAGLVACLPGWVGSGLDKAQRDLLLQAQAERRASLAEEARANPPPRPSALGYVAKRSRRWPAD